MGVDGRLVTGGEIGEEGGVDPPFGQQLGVELDAGEHFGGAGQPDIERLGRDRHLK